MGGEVGIEGVVQVFYEGEVGGEGFGFWDYVFFCFQFFHD